jgi:hypothetical protein
MKKAFFLMVLFFSTSMFADVVTIEGRTYDVEITKIKRNKIHFSLGMDQYVVPMSKIDMIYIEENNASFAESAEVLSQIAAEEDPCLMGIMDAQARGKTAVNVLGGMFFGPFALIHKALKDFHPSKDYQNIAISGHKDLMDNPNYIQCYRKKAQTKALAETAGGWATWILLVLMTSGQ